ncbi:hypothetical protein QYM36_015155 [Artemia franciscana]|uniref:Peptidase A2 domain-containing protein n=1 Tax=Artemia franciscana TaxID=6661 RepID=A0AA88KX47_ARTSF|nr:hypothetical protein QYM36_015155 [Artemia franciscana]
MNLAGKPPCMKLEIEAVRRVKSKTPLCYLCGGLYSREHRCPAKGKTCTKCHKPNHFAKVCRSKNLHEVETAEDDEGEEFCIEAIDSLCAEAPEKPFVAIRLTQYNTDIKFKIDTGSEVNVLPTADFLNLKGASLQLTKTKDILTSYIGGQLKVVGTINLMLQYKKQRPQNHVFYVVETDKGPILSRQTSKKLKLIKFLMSISRNTSSSTTKAVPTVQPPKRVPFALQPKLKQELECLEALEVIEKTTKPTEWVNSIVLVEKGDGSLRICLDPVDLNCWIKRPHHPVPLFEDIAAKCEGARKFFKVDARSGYWSMVLDDKSSELTTFNTVFGQYCWKRYPFGLVSAQDEYQKKMEEAFEGIDIGLIIDDIAGMGATDEEQDRKLAEVLLRAKEKGVKFNRDKWIFDASSIPYYGHVLTEEGVKPDPNKTRPLCDLMKAKVWKWDGIHEAAWKTIQESISKNLAYFSQHAKLSEVATDASQHGVGTQLITDGATVAFASRSLSETERRYSQMENELLDITFACKHFHQYLFSQKVYVITYHKPLEAILSKAINHAPPRLQSMMLAIQPYDLTFHYRPGKEIPVADTLSRLHLFDVDKEAESKGELAIHTFFKQIPITEKRMERKAQLKQKTAYDRRSRTATELNSNQKVWVKLSDDSKWEKATIKKKYDKAPRSCNLSLESGGTFRRNRRDIRPRYEFASPTTYDGQQIGVADTIPPMGNHFERLHQINKPQPSLSQKGTGAVHLCKFKLLLDPLQPQGLYSQTPCQL